MQGEIELEPIGLDHRAYRFFPKSICSDDNRVRVKNWLRKIKWNQDHVLRASGV